MEGVMRAGKKKRAAAPQDAGMTGPKDNEPATKAAAASVDDSEKKIATAPEAVAE